ncbi:hypothetical protein [Undibacter mobilis]|uniref:Uncharacterized protein n=1 Tax=Undibacter mobilis TaxID=2292256 RepID=A0A371B0A5_9BRAD|nr:hypothetical protein [Undibacter mobilis]RDV01029.1 hypothetical protein DXH78_19530 [Undibacter mobilis]
MTHRTIQVVVRRTVTYERIVTAQVEETAERVNDDARYPMLCTDEAKDAAIAKAKSNTLTGWEPGATEYEAVWAQVVPNGKMVDVAI